jgi:hypothetical protein
LLGNSNEKTDTPQQEKGNCFHAFRAEKKHSDIGSLLPGNAAVNMHPEQWETVLSVGSVQRSYLNNKLRYSSVLSSEFSGGDSHGNFV